MKMLVEEPGAVLLDGLTPSEVRHLAAERLGGVSPLLRDRSGTDDRTALPFSVRGKDGEVAIFAALAGVEAEAALQLVEALHRGSLRSFTRVGPSVCRILPDYWEPRHSAFNLDVAEGRTLFWGEDEVGQHHDRPIPAEARGATIVIREADAMAWLQTLEMPLAKQARLTPTERDEECRRVAAILDEKGIAQRHVTSAHVANLWSADKGTPVAVATVKAFMRGQPRGRPVGGPKN